MRNTGTTTWTAAGSYRLGSLAAGDPWGNRVYLNNTEKIAPGQQKVFTISATAPQTAGTYGFQWIMLQELVELFGPATPAVNVTVTAAVNGAAFVSQSVPSSVLAGGAFTATVTMRNTGTTTWTAAGSHRLGGLVTGDPWGNRVYLTNTEKIAPGQQKAFRVSATAPQAAGTYGFQWIMLKELVELFGPATPLVSVTVTAAPLSAYSVDPCRVIDTRNPTGPYGGPALAAGGTRLFQMRGRCGVPSTARAVVITMAAFNATSQGFLEIYPANLPLPATSSVNYRAGLNRTNNGIVTLDSTGQLAVAVGQASGTVHFIAEVTGYLQ